MSPVRNRLGEELVARGVLSEGQLKIALEEQKQDSRPLGQLLVALGFVRSADVSSVVADELGLPLTAAGDVLLDRALSMALDESFVRSSRALPIEHTATGLRVLMVDPSDAASLSSLRDFYRSHIEVEMVTEEDFDLLLREAFQDRRADSATHVASLVQGTDRLDNAVEKVTEGILIDAIRQGATDIHFQPDERATRVRFRKEGVMSQVASLPREATAAVVSRIKILAELDIAERRRPQDGHLRQDVDGHTIDLRVSTMPCSYGESVVLRILDRGGGNLPLHELGFPPDVCAGLKEFADRPHGLVLVTGPTGSGKTTTLYSTLGHVDSLSRNVATIEDPIECQLPFIRQSQVDAAIGFTFDIGLRSLLRQDPDVILVGEIRDLETAGMAIKASMTGHLVFSTLHTNSAIGAVARLTDMGIAPYLVEDCLLGVLGQRLIRRLCQSCRDWRPAEKHERAFFGPQLERLPVRTGCGRCQSTGYEGRKAVGELFVPDEGTRDLIREGAGAAVIARDARARGFLELGKRGFEAVLTGELLLEDVMRAAGMGAIPSPSEAGERDAA